MPRIRFKRTVLHSLSELVNRGYRFAEGRDSHIIEFRKILTPSVYAQVEFQLYQIFIAPTREFNVNLLRIRLPSFPEIESRYTTLNVGLYQLMKIMYEQDIFPADTFGWEFTDESSLQERLAYAQTLVIDYGIKWLEDPLSDMDLIIKRMRGQT